MVSVTSLPLKIVSGRAGETVQSVACLPSPEGREEAGIGEPYVPGTHWPSSLAELMGSRLIKRLHLKS